MAAEDDGETPVNRRMHTGTDIILCIMPKVLPEAPTIGACLLKSYLVQAGFTAEVMDLNISLFNAMQARGEQRFFFEEDHVFLPDNSDGMVPTVQFTDAMAPYHHIFMQWVADIKQRDPRYVGMSLLSEYSLSISLLLCKLLRQHAPETKIIWGGPFVDKWMMDYRRADLVHHIIMGDAEHSLVAFMRGETGPGIDDHSEPQQVTDIETMLVPDYDDIDWASYPADPPVVYVTTSRGCVKKCTFCNVPNLWPRFTYRSAEGVMREIRQLCERHDRHVVKFTDSLLNGSMKNCTALLQLMRDHKRDRDPSFGWHSQWIMRPRSQVPEDYFQLMKDSGCFGLEIGIECLSQDVRWHMGKKFTDDDMMYNLEMMQKHEIRAVSLMIVGYPTETEREHQQTLDMIREFGKRGWLSRTNAWGGKLLYLNYSNTMMIWNDVPIYDMIRDELTDFTSPHVWTYRDNTYPVRVRRLKEIHQLIKDLEPSERHVWLTTRNLKQLDDRLSVSADGLPAAVIS